MRGGALIGWRLLKGSLIRNPSLTPRLVQNGSKGGRLIEGRRLFEGGGLNRRFTVLHFHSAHAPLNCDDGGRLPYKFICILLIDDVIIGLNLGINFDLIFTTFIPDEDTRLECRNVES